MEVFLTTILVIAAGIFAGGLAAMFPFGSRRTGAENSSLTVETPKDSRSNLDDLFRGCFEHCHHAMLVLSPNREYLTSNDAFAKLTCIPPETFSIEGLASMLPPEDCTKFAEKLKAICDGACDSFSFSTAIGKNGDSPVNVDVEARSLRIGRRDKFDIFVQFRRQAPTPAALAEVQAKNAILEDKLSSLTHPKVDTSELSMADIFDMAEIQKIQDAFADATGVASIITDVDGKPLTRPSNFCRLCSDIIRKTEKGLCNCYHSDAVLGRLHPNGPVIQPCLSGGLWDGGTSICVGDRHIANWLIGQILEEPVNEEAMLKYAREIGADETEFRQALKEVPRLPKERFIKICKTLYIIAGQLSKMAVQNIQQARLIHAKHQAELAVRASEESLRITLDSIGDAVIATDIGGQIVRLNPVAQKLTGWQGDMAIGKNLNEVLPLINANNAQPLPSPLEKIIKRGQTTSLPSDTMLISRNGKKIQIADSGAPIRSDSGEIVGAVLVFRDISEQKKIEQQLLHSQQMDSIGQLAGGIAHDFNNMLGGIMGAAELIGDKFHHDPETLDIIDLIIKTAEKAANLNQKLLTFSRKTKVRSVPVDIHEVINDTLQILERSIDRRIAMCKNLAAENATIVGDPIQLQNLILNIAINARDAMPNGGLLQVTTKKVQLDATFIGTSGFKADPGMYLMLEISDTGTGIDHTILPHIFEPFFTTKEPGKGTGLGLSAVYGTVKHHRGIINVYSEPGKGSSFKVYLPITEQKAERPAVIASDKVLPKGITILLVEDEDVIRQVAAKTLMDAGCKIIVSPDGQAGVEEFRQNFDTIDLVIMDMVMPKMSGREAFEAMRKINDKVKVLFASGFARDSNMTELMQNSQACGFIQKPFRKQELLQAIVDAMNQKQTE